MAPYHITMLDQVARRADEFDVLHFHIDHLHYPVMRQLLQFAQRPRQAAPET
ncbi:hypothetical protein [Bradyrhizobium manausense]|uniref:hypothetical protein n=1 Tax=Bradyrhizobium manausense TaxID=989370 RepID=UPI000B033DAA|nr:hypothetical protein [Bradyrhizobium manausense]